MNNKIFESIFNESFEDDLAAHRNAEKELIRHRRRNDKSVIAQKVKDISTRKNTFTYGSHNYALGYDNTNEDKSPVLNFCVDGEKVMDLTAENAGKFTCKKIANYIANQNKDFEDSYFDQLFEVAFSYNDMEKFLKDVELVGNIINTVNGAIKNVEKYTFKNAIQNREDTYLNKKSDYKNTLFKARGSLDSITPEFKEGDYVIWYAQDGRKKVKLISINKDKKRAKIQTKNGAKTITVKLSDIEKYVDYPKYSIEREYDLW